MKIKFLVCMLLTNLFFLAGCSITEPQHNGRDAIDQALQDSFITNQQAAAKDRSASLPRPVADALAFGAELPVHARKSAKVAPQETKFDVVVNNVPAKDFFMGLVKGSKYNVAVDQAVAGNITLDLRSVTIPQAMDAVRDIYGFEYEITSYGYKIFPRRLETRIFNVNYIDIDRSGHSQTALGSGQITNTVQNTLTSTGVSSTNQTGSIPSGMVSTSTSSKFWELLKQNLESLIGTQEGRSIVVNSRSGVIIAKAYPNELRALAQYLDSIQGIVNRQVVIEAKVLEVRLNAQFQSGINWRALGLTQGYANSGSGKDDPTFNNDLISGFTGVLRLNASDGGAFNTVINLLNAQGNVNVLSSPRIATINNQKAVIKVGTDRFFVTNISTNTNSTNNNDKDNVTSDITLTPFFSGISLDVTPQIDENDFVTIHIHPIVSQVLEDPRKITVNNKDQNLPLAQSEVRESDSIVRAKNGQVIVIGGLMQSSGQSLQNSTPGTEKLPLVSGLFKNSKKAAEKYELVILLRPIISESIDSWQKQLQDAAHNFRQMSGNFSYNVVPEKKNH